jgi:hypothetical protein
VKQLAQQLVVVGICALWLVSALPANAANPRVDSIGVKSGSFETALPASAPASFVFDTQRETKVVNN